MAAKSASAYCESVQTFEEFWFHSVGAASKMLFRTLAKTEEIKVMDWLLSSP